MRVLGIADSDSYLKWAAALLDRLPPDAERALAVMRTPVAPSPEQVRSATTGTRFEPNQISELSLDDLVEQIRATEPDVILLAVRGPVVRVLVRAIRASGVARPVLISGFPGISYPVVLKAIVYRELVDVVIVHSHREIREFSALATQYDYSQRFALARFPFLPSADRHSDHTGGLIFAAQAKVPYTRDERLAILEWLAEAARRRPECPVVIKVRAIGAEAQTHPERWNYADLLGQIADAPSNLIVADGAMAEHLAHASGLVTISSTAVLEAIAWDVPAVVLSDFGVDDRMINSVYRGSGIIGTRDDVISGHLRRPTSTWSRDNYLHDDSDSTWRSELDAVLALRRAGALPWLIERPTRFGGAVRRAWDRKQTLGRYDRSLGGYLALAIGRPLRGVVRMVRAERNRRTQHLDVDEATVALEVQ